MRTTSLTLLGTAFALLLPATSAHAQATGTWVSGVGDDVNPCSRTAPCKTFAGAISKTATNGEIRCLDPGGFGAVTITKSISIDCHEIPAFVLNASTTGVIINFDAFQAADTRKNVFLRNLIINGANSGLNGVRIIGGAASSGSKVVLEDMTMENQFGSPGRGISDERSGGGKLFVNNTLIENVGNSGIFSFPGNGTLAGQPIGTSISNTRIANAAVHGIVIGDNGRAMISRTVVTGNGNNGFSVQGFLAASEANINDSVSSGNAVGLGTQGSATMRVSNSDIAFNITEVSGTVASFSNNRFSSNGAGGVVNAIAPAGTNPSGQK